jgi:pre-mRNA-processing factor 40
MHACANVEQVQQPAAAKPTSGNGWKEYTAPDGRKYYHKAATNTTQWTRPAEMDEPAPATAPEGAAAVGAGGGAGGGDAADKSNGDTGAAGEAAKENGKEVEAQKKEVKKKVKPEPVPDLPAKKYESKEEAMADFKELLDDKIKSHKTTWDEAVNELKFDVRFKALKSVGEKKNVFQNFIAKRQRDFVETERVRKKQAKVDFQALLLETEPAITHASRYRDMQEQLAQDERFAKVDSDRERVDLFEDYVMELEKKEKERLRAARTENLAAFRVLLSEIPGLTSKTRWSEVKTMVKEDERFLALEGDDKYRLEAFDDYMVGLARKEAEEREMIKEQKRALEKEQRAAFTTFLSELGEKGLINALSQWRDFRDTEEAKSDDRFKDMLEQSKSKAQVALCSLSLISLCLYFAVPQLWQDT